MRVRVRDDTISSPSAFKYVHNGVDKTYYPGTTAVLGKKEVMKDVIVPNFSKRSAQGGVFVNPMDQRSVETHATAGPYHYKNGSHEYVYPESWWYFDSIGTPNHLPVSNIHTLPSLGTLAGTEARANIDDPLFEGAVFLGELRETLQFVRKPVDTLTDYFSEAGRKARKRRDYKKHWKGRTVADFIQNNWLAYRYGMRPLLADMNNAMVAVEATLHNATPKRRTARGYASDSGFESTSTEATYGTRTDALVQSTSLKRSARAGILYEQVAMANTFGASLRDVPATLWEIVPYSFVADWFWNVGSYIQAITPFVGVNVLGQWTTYESEHLTTRNFHVKENAGWDVLSNASCGDVTREVHKERRPGVTVGLSTKVRPFGGDIGKARALDALHLMKQQINKRL